MVTSHHSTASDAALSIRSKPPAIRTTPPVTPVHFAPSATPLLETPLQPPSEDEIRTYANHLYLQRGSVDGHEQDDWLEAEACLAANIPKESSRTRIHHHTQITERATLALVKHGRS